MQRSPNPETPSLLFIEGNTGAGKTTLAHLIKQQLNAHIINEPLEKWQKVGGDENLFDIYLNNRKRWGYTFQSYALTTFIEACTESHARNRLHIADRSAHSAFYCFARMMLTEGSMSPAEFQIYKESFEWLAQRAPKPKGYIYIRTSPKNCFARALKRCRPEETTLNMNFFTLLHQFHEEWLINKHDILPFIVDIPVLILDGNCNFIDNAATQKLYLEKINEFISTLT